MKHLAPGMKSRVMVLLPYALTWAVWTVIIFALIISQAPETGLPLPRWLFSAMFSAPLGVIGLALTVIMKELLWDESLLPLFIYLFRGKDAFDAHDQRPRGGY